MSYPWLDFKSLPFLQNHFLIFKGHRPFAFKDIKELPRHIVIVHYFRAARRDTFLNYAHVITFEKMPAITGFAPDIMFRVFNGNNHAQLHRIKVGIQ